MTEYVTVGEAARILAVSPKTIYRLIWRGKLPVRRLGRALRIPASAVGVRGVTSTETVSALPSLRGSRSGIGDH